MINFVNIRIRQNQGEVKAMNSIQDGTGMRCKDFFSCFSTYFLQQSDTTVCIFDASICNKRVLCILLFLARRALMRVSAGDNCVGVCIFAAPLPLRIVSLLASDVAGRNIGSRFPRLPQCQGQTYTLLSLQKCVTHLQTFHSIHLVDRFQA